MIKPLKWQQKYLDHIKSLTNELLWEEFLWIMQSDDYDGCFTNRGQWYMETAKEELELRLLEFLREDLI